ncbi:MAG: nucleoside-diphosphate kinase [Candidatus Micrarchaeaceae archaeon]
MNSRTLVIIKPDGVERNILGEVIRRFENAGLKVIGIKMLIPDEKLVRAHYNANDESWLKSVGEKRRKSYESKGIKVSKSDIEVGKEVAEYLVSYLTRGPVVAIALEGNEAVSIARKISGSTEPKSAMPGTIRGDFSSDSYDLADSEKRAVENIVHASDEENAEREIKLWFKEEELFS